MQHIYPTKVPRRDPSHVMRLERMGSFHQSRLSFMRILLRRLKAERWRFDRPLFDIDADCEGVAVYSAHGPERSYSLIAFANDLPPEKRSDRVIATQWDATFTLFDGIPTSADLERLSANVPLQEAGRISERELSLSRANRSVRLWEYVVDCLASGRQPDKDRVAAVGYLMRTTAVYGSGKFGAADRDTIADRPEFTAPFQVEMLNVFLIRAFVMDLVEHAAHIRAPDKAIVLDPTLRSGFGIGNSTGLGMAPFLINHPILLNNWIMAREEALARVRSVERASIGEASVFHKYIARAQENARIWHSDHPLQAKKLGQLRADLDRIADQMIGFDVVSEMPWDRLWNWGQRTLSIEGQEQLASLLLEPYPQLVDGLADCMSADESLGRRIDGRMSVDGLMDIVTRIYDWALDVDWNDQSDCARVWYVSEEKLEPRLGERFEEDIEPYEQPLCPGRDIARMYRDLARCDTNTVGSFLMRYPEHRHIARRAQIAARFPYAEICDNTIAADMLPIDMLRAKLSFFGARHFDPRSDRWVRINMYQGAPFPKDLETGPADDWTYPVVS